MTFNQTNIGSAQADALIGKTIDDKYRLEAKLGEGGMGSVYMATRLLIGDTVAIKILHSERLADAQAVERFRREAQAAARLKHPNAVAIYDFGVSNEGLVHLVMEMVEGESLRSIIKQQGPLTPSAAAEVLSQVCAALDEAHRQQIIHRDLKPDNIIVTATGSGLRVKVLDFGIAKIRNIATTADNLTQTGTVMGTPHYMSPEQCLGEEIDSRSDIYSLGVLLFEMLSGMVPFNSPASTAVVVQHVTQPPPPLRLINASISPAVEAVVLHALAKPREARPPTAGALALEMTAAINGTPITHAYTGGLTYPGASVPLAPPNTPAAGMQPTVQMKTPSWSGAVTPAGVQPMPAGATPMTKTSSKLVPLIVGAALLLVIAAGVVIWVTKSGNKTETANTKSKAETTGAPTPPPGMVYVAGGEFLMGNDGGDVYERPTHKVTVKPFFIDLYEVTCEDYEKFVRAAGHRAPPDWLNGQMPPGAARRPVTGVDWDDASAYARWAGKRLPAEAEWEYAARGSDGRRYPWGDDWRPGFANADATTIGRMSDVGAYSAGTSPSGAFNMVGNAWEWTASDLTAYPGGILPPQPPGDLKIMRGGCWKSSQSEATTTYRMRWLARGAETYDTTSFRCVKDGVQ